MDLHVKDERCVQRHVAGALGMGLQRLTVQTGAKCLVVWLKCCRKMTMEATDGKEGAGRMSGEERKIAELVLRRGWPENNFHRRAVDRLGMHDSRVASL